jgi:hypothetical protein
MRGGSDSVQYPVRIDVLGLLGEGRESPERMKNTAAKLREQGTKTRS